MNLAVLGIDILIVYRANVVQRSAVRRSCEWSRFEGAGLKGAAVACGIQPKGLAPSVCLYHVDDTQACDMKMQRNRRQLQKQRVAPKTQKRGGKLPGTERGDTKPERDVS